MNISVLQLHERLSEFIRTEKLLCDGEPLLLAVSGGVDSMVMLDLFARLAVSWNFQLFVVHVNHQLRGTESDEDESFVRTRAEALRITCFSKRVDTAGYALRHHLGKQEAARHLRYEYFSELSRSLNAPVLTAHHADDNAETVLFNALRGAGLRGLSGIPIKRDFVIRPLLFARKSELQAYAAERAVPFRTDSSNRTLQYRRNVLRSLLPRLGEAGFPDAVESLNRLARSMHYLSVHVQQQVEAILPQVSLHEPFALFSLDLERFAAIAGGLQEEVALAILRRLGIEPTSDRVKLILEVRLRPTGWRCDIGRGIVVYRHRNSGLFYRPSDYGPFEVPVRPEGIYSFSNFQFEMRPAKEIPSHFPLQSNQAFVDAHKLGRRLVLRSWRPGDWFVPLGMHSKKKLSDFFTDRKLSPIEKSMTPLLESDGAVVWVCGQRIDDRFKVSPETTSALELTYHSKYPGQTIR